MAKVVAVQYTSGKDLGREVYIGRSNLGRLKGSMGIDNNGEIGRGGKREENRWRNKMRDRRKERRTGIKW